MYKRVLPRVCERRLLAVRSDDLLVVCSRTTRSRPVVQARPDVHQRRCDQRCLVSLPQQFACLGVLRAATHSPNTFFRISQCREFAARKARDVLQAHVYSDQAISGAHLCPSEIA
jgi:hypothetical protein